MSQPPTWNQDGQPFGGPYPPQAYGQPTTYGQPQAYGADLQQYQGYQQHQSYQQHQVAPTHYAQRYGQYPLVSAGGRFGSFLLDYLLAIVTLGIGWFIWSLFTWVDGQSPAKKLLGYVVVDANTGLPFTWGQMALREFCIKGLLGWFLNMLTLTIYFWVDCFMIFGDRQRTLHDRIANSVVRPL